MSEFSSALILAFCIDLPLVYFFKEPKLFFAKNVCFLTMAQSLKIPSNYLKVS